MRKMILTTAAILAVTMAVAAHADESGQSADTQASGAALNERATGAQFADPTAPNSFRSHGRP